MRKMTAFLLVLLLCAGMYVPAAAGESETGNNTAGEIAAGETEAGINGAGESAAVDLSAAEPAEDGLLRIGLTESVSTMDVQKTSGDYLIPLNIYERLYDIRVNEDGTTQLVNGLAEECEISGDGRVYKFTLREDAYFSDGTPVKASDVAFTFTRMLALPESVQTDFADVIFGAKDVIDGTAQVLEGIRVVDEKHLEITLSEPYAGYLSMLATPACSIYSEKNVTRAGSGFGQAAEDTIGSGPYMVTAFGEDKITLEKNPFYHCHEGEELSAEKVEIRILAPAIMDLSFREGTLDILDTYNINPDVAEKVYKSAEWKDRLVSRDRVEIRYLMLNVEAKPLDDVRIRKAIQLAINRQRILDELFGGDGDLLDGIYPKGLIGYCEENQGWLVYDPEEAKKLIGEVPGAEKIRLELAANSQTSVRYLTILEMIRQDLQAVGLNVSIVSYDEDSMMYLRKEGKLMAYTSEWIADFNDPDNFIYTFFGSREKTKYRSGNYSDEEVISRITAARTMADTDERLEEYAELERILVRDEAVWVPLFSTDHLFVKGDRVESFTPFWAGWSSMYFKDVILK